MTPIAWVMAVGLAAAAAGLLLLTILRPGSTAPGANFARGACVGGCFTLCAVAAAMQVMGVPFWAH